MKTETIDMTPTHAALCHHLLHVHGRPRNASDQLTREDWKEDRKLCTLQVQQLNEAQDNVEKHFMMLSRFVDAYNECSKAGVEFPKEFTEKIAAINAEYRG